MGWLPAARLAALVVVLAREWRAQAARQQQVVRERASARAVPEPVLAGAVRRGKAVAALAKASAFEVVPL